MDYDDHKLRGKAFKPKNPLDMIVMNGSGVFFVYNNEEYYPSIRKLSDVLFKYDVVWK
jgi:hypothetical protein